MLHTFDGDVAGALRYAKSQGEADMLRLALSEDAPRGHNLVRAALFDSKTGRWNYLGKSRNSRVSQGASWQAGIMGNATGNASSNYIGITTDTGAVANADVVLASELTSNGLGRAAASYGSYSAPGSLGASASYIMSITFTYTGSGAVVIAKAGQYYGSSGSKLTFEALLSATATVASSGDSLALAWTVQI
jgi:hypothetical protein